MTIRSGNTANKRAVQCDQCQRVAKYSDSSVRDLRWGVKKLGWRYIKAPFAREGQIVERRYIDLCDICRRKEGRP